MQNSSIGRKLMVVSKKDISTKQNVEFVQKQQLQEQCLFLLTLIKFHKFVFESLLLGWDIFVDC